MKFDSVEDDIRKMIRHYELDSFHSVEDDVSPCSGGHVTPGPPPTPYDPSSYSARTHHIPHHLLGISSIESARCTRTTDGQLGIESIRPDSH